MKSFIILHALFIWGAALGGGFYSDRALASAQTDTSDWLQLTSKPQFWLGVKNDPSQSAAQRETCATLHDALTVSNSGAVRSECHGYLSEAELQRDRANAQATGHFKYVVSAARDTQGALQLDILKGQLPSPASDDGTGFKQARWTIAPPDASPSTSDSTFSQRDLTQKRIEKFMEFDRHERLVREVLLARAMPASKAVRLNANGRYEDSVTGRTLSFEEAWKEFGLERPKHKHYLRAGIEITAVLGIGLALYFKDVDINSEDWDLDWSIGSLRKKLTFEAVAFDNNRFNTNALSHSLSGALFYLFPRSNNFSVLESTLFAFTASSLWEYLCEYREKVSINDQVFTPLAGAVIGEVIHQLGTFFDRGAPTFANRILGSIFGSPDHLHRWMDKISPERDSNVDQLGFSREIWHEFQVFGSSGVIQTTSAAAGSTASPILEVGLETQIVSVPGWGHPGRVSRFLADGNFTQLLAKASFANGGVQDFVFYVKAAMFGYYKQNLSVDANKKLRGYSFIIAGSSAFDYRLHEKDLHGGAAAPNADRGITQSDQVAVVNVLGPTMDLTIHHKGLRIRAQIDVFGDFAMLRSYAIEKYIDQGGSLDGMKASVQGGRYYFAFGLSVNSRLQASYNGFEAGFELKVDEFASFQSGDRGPVSNNQGFTDQAARFKLWLAYLLPGDRLKLQLALERYYRAGQLDDIGVSEQRTETRLMGSLILML